MKIIICADHAGLELKQQLKNHLQLKHEIIDVGANIFDENDSYVLYAQKANKLVVENNCFGIYICGSGVGMNIVANKYKGIRAATCQSVDLAIKCREHNNCNVLCLGSRFSNLEDAIAIADKFLSTDFLGGKHQTRVDSIE